MAKPVKPAKKKKSGNLLVHVVILRTLMFFMTESDKPN